MSYNVATVASPAASSAINPFAGMTANGGPNGMFLNFMAMFGMNQAASTDPAQSTQSLQFGQAGFSFDPALLVLPTGVANLSEDDLQSLLTAISSGQETTLSPELLAALTPGIPSTPLPTTPVKVAAQVISIVPEEFDPCVLTVTSENLNPLTVPSDDMPANPLLIASGLSPAQIEQLKDQIAASAQAVTDAQDVSDGSAAIAMVNFVAAPVQNNPAIMANTPLDTAVDIPALNQNPAGLAIAATASAQAGEVASDAPKAASPFAQRPLRPFEISQLAQEAESSAASGNAPATNDVADAERPGAEASVKADIQAGLGKLDKLSHFFMASNGNFDMTSGMIPTALNQVGSGQSTSLTTPLLNNASAAASHPATQTIAVMLEKAAANGEVKEQTLRVELDPPELGRVQIQLSYEKGEAMKVHLLAEKQETLNLLQRDSHALKAALDQAGVKMDGSSLSFDMAGGNQSFDQMLGQFHDGRSSHSHQGFSLDGTNGHTAQSGTETTVMQVKMNNIPDFSNGNLSYDFFA